MALEVSPNVSSTTKTMGHHKQEGIDEAAEASVWSQNGGGALLEGCYILTVGAAQKCLRRFGC